MAKNPSVGGLTEREARDLIQQCLDRLGEHFDAVQILASYGDSGNTGCMTFGCGNWYARQGMAHEFINRDVAQENATQISQMLTMDQQDD